MLINAKSLSRKVAPPQGGATLTIREATAIAGTLSNPSKMPGRGYGLPARECAVGSRLRDVKGSVCEGCYALKGNYQFGNVQRSQYARLDAINDPAWVDAMVVLVTEAGDRWFRWHDSGDLQSLEHLQGIAEIARRLPRVRFWLPTREYAIVRAYLDAEGMPPANLTIRASAHMVDGKTPDALGVPTSGVHSDWEAYLATNPGARRCPAPEQGNACRNCRACWDSSISSVSYHLH